MAKTTLVRNYTFKYSSSSDYCRLWHPSNNPSREPPVLHTKQPSSTQKQLFSSHLSVNFSIVHNLKDIYISWFHFYTETKRWQINNKLCWCNECITECVWSSSETKLQLYINIAIISKSVLSSDYSSEEEDDCRDSDLSFTEDALFIVFGDNRSAFLSSVLELYCASSVEMTVFLDWAVLGLAYPTVKDVSASDSDEVSSRAKRGKSLALNRIVVLLDATEFWGLMAPLIGFIFGFLFVLFSDIGAATIIAGTSAFSSDSMKKWRGRRI